MLINIPLRTSVLRTVIATGVLLSCGTGTAVAATNVVTFDSPGEYPVVVPAGVTSLHVVAVGGRGGEGTYSVPGGFGARVTANLTVTAGTTRYLLVGGNGQTGVNHAGAGGGGGASDVRTAPSSAGLTPIDPRILVAGGGGGSGFGHNHGVDGSAGYGGDAGAVGGNSRRSVYPGSITSGGGAAGVPVGTGAGGTSGAVDFAGGPGGAGSLGRGGDGALADEHRGLTQPGFNGGGHGGGGAAPGPFGNVTFNGGGGGGGGLHGGGGGGGVWIFGDKDFRSAVGGAGGGGGSNLVPAGGSAVTDTVGSGSITVSFDDANAPVVSLDDAPTRVAGAITVDGTAGAVLGDAGTVTLELYAGSTVTGSPVRTIDAGLQSGARFTAAFDGLAQGPHTVRATQSDGAGNVGVSTARTFTNDTVAPVVSLSSPAGGAVLRDPAPSFAGTAGTAIGDEATVQVEVRDARGAVVQTLSAQRNGTTGAYVTPPSVPLPDGTYSAVATQSDDLENRATSSSVSFRVDTYVPTPPVITPPAITPPDVPTGGAAPPLPGTGGTGQPNGGGTTPLTPTVDRTKPVLRRVGVKPASLTKTKKGRKTTLRYTLSEGATVSIAVTRSGRRTPVGTLRSRGKKGVNRVTVTRRVGKKRLEPGRYVLTLTAVDAAGNRSGAKTVDLRVR